jgi:ABC-type Co2+ transport system permease subunit
VNTVAYLMYLALTYWVTVHVGWRFYRNGRFYLLALFRNDAPVADAVNRLLLTGYYLLNLGYVALMLRSWPTLLNWTEVLLSVCLMTGRILLTLGLIHFCNMGLLYLLRKRPEMMELKS